MKYLRKILVRHRIGILGVSAIVLWAGFLVVAVVLSIAEMSQPAVARPVTTTPEGVTVYAVWDRSSGSYRWFAVGKDGSVAPVAR